MPPKYGLQLPPAGRGRGAPPRPTPGALAAFGDDDSDDDGGGAAAVGRDVARQAARIAADEKVAAMHAAALAEDATAFEYDAVYDDLAAARGARAGGSGRVGGGAAAAAPAVDRAPRYVADLLDRAKERAAADELAKERRLARQRQEEDHLYGDKEVFVTAAYKEKLAARDAARAADAAAAAAEAAAAPATVGNMAGFYKNLLTDNVALGTGKEMAEKVAAPAAPPPPSPAAAPPPPPPPAAAAPPPKKSPSPPPPQQPAVTERDDIEARAAAARERYFARKRARAA